MTIDTSLLRYSERASRRTAMGVGDSTMLVAALADPPSSMEALDALMAVGLARETGRDLVVVMSPQVRGLERGWRVVDAVNRGRTMMVDAAVDRPWELLPACDAALVMTTGASALWAMAAGLPIVAPSTPAIRQQLTDGVTALFAPGGKVGQIAQRLCRLYDDRKLGARLGAAAKEWIACQYLTPLPRRPILPAGERV